MGRNLLDLCLAHHLRQLSNMTLLWNKNMKIMSVFTILLIFTSLAFADLGTKWPTQHEMDKAPAWPEKYSGNPKSCQKISEENFIKSQEEDGYVGEEEFTIDSQIDLNLDGVCEIIAYQKIYCGNIQCGYVAFHYKDNKYIRLGDIYPDEFLVPHDGWLQVRGYTYTGQDYALHLIRYDNGSYHYVRTDRYKYDEQSNRTIYINSEYYK